MAVFGGNNTSGPLDVATAVRAKGGTGHGDFESESFVVASTLRARDMARGVDSDCTDTLIAHTLRAEGFDAGEDGTGRGTPLVVSGTLLNGGKSAGSATGQDAENGLLVPVAFDETQITSPGNYSTPKPGDACHPLAAGARPPAIAFDCKASGRNGFGVGDVSPTLRAMGHGEGHQNAGGQVAVAIDCFNGTIDGEVAATVRRGNGGAMGGVPAVAFQASQSGMRTTGEAHPTLDANNGSRRHHGALIGSAVRRLTPRECERLQGFPDDWTRVPVRRYKRPPDTAHYRDWPDLYEAQPDGSVIRFQADGPRYRQMGNSMAVPVMRWIGERIAAVDEILGGEEREG